jgi:dipeptidyl aminopeptidase/acylaminoacyl peptidase
VRRDEFPVGVFVHEENGSWELQFNDDGTYLFFVDGVVDATGSYSTVGDLYIETTDYAPCRHARTATYRWTYDGRRLAFQLVGEDGCSPRRSSLDGVSWIRRQAAQAIAPGDERSGRPTEEQ